ncbi:MAG TPA: hypothetical protein VH518_24945 [Tepidisphaeraceae bacterium]
MTARGPGIEESLDALYDQLSPHLRPSGSSGPIAAEGCVQEALRAAALLDDAPYARARKAIVADAVLRRGEKLAGPWGNPDTLILRILVAALTDCPNQPTLDRQRGLHALRLLCEQFESPTLKCQLLARLRGVKMDVEQIRLSDHASLVRLSDEEINQTQPVLDPVTAEFHSGPVELGRHHTELRARFEVPLAPFQKLPMLYAHQRARVDAQKLIEDVIAALLLSYPGQIDFTDVRIVHPIVDPHPTRLPEQARWSLTPNSMILDDQAPQRLQESIVRRDRIRTDKVLATSFNRFLLGRQRAEAVDRVVDFVIAWESILLTVGGKAQMQESRYRFSVNGALLLRACGVEANPHAGRHFMEAAYEVRSAMVHGASDLESHKRLARTGHNSIAHLAETLERHYRRAIGWLADLAPEKRPYAMRRGSDADGWDVLLWGMNAAA